MPCRSRALELPPIGRWRGAECRREMLAQGHGRAEARLRRHLVDRTATRYEQALRHREPLVLQPAAHGRPGGLPEVPGEGAPAKRNAVDLVTFK